MKLAQAMVFVHDAAKMQAFYEGLGLRVVDGDASSGFVRLADPAGGAVLALHATKAIGPGGPPRVDTPTKLCFHVEDLDRIASIGGGAHRITGARQDLRDEVADILLVIDQQDINRGCAGAHTTRLLSRI